ncbi:unnamed protein product [Haemonchus placei]|uniref:Salivary lipocalin n=1 Tax=Haemonchus placei TaxID=6290 RepID=A0A0N4W6H0_HAEPC|nr:unnamed protein product [Haemonchus placei]
MMLIILTVFLPVVRLETEERLENCQALKETTVPLKNLSDSLKEELEKDSAPKSCDIDGIATYYIGSPDTSNKLLFTAVCISAKELKESPYCYNTTSTNGIFSGSKISEERFKSFYGNCSNDLEIELEQMTSETEILSE